GQSSRGGSRSKDPRDPSHQRLESVRSALVDPLQVVLDAPNRRLSVPGFGSRYAEPVRSAGCLRREKGLGSVRAGCAYPVANSLALEASPMAVLGALVPEALAPRARLSDDTGCPAAAPDAP